MSIRSLNDVRAGDIMICGMSTAPTRALVYTGQLLLGELFRIGKFVAGHAAVVIPGGKIVEAMPSGARVRDLRESDWSTGHRYFRLLEDYPGQSIDAAIVAQAMIDTPYSLASYAYLGAYLGGVDSECLTDRIDRRRLNTRFELPNLSDRTALDLPVEAICSVLAEQAWTLTGKKVIRGTKPQVVTPGMLTSQLYNRPGVISGGLGLL